MKQQDQRTSGILLSIIEQMRKEESLIFYDIIAMLQGRAFGLAIVLLCIPNCLPIPNIAGLSAITGIPIIIIGLEMLAGRSQIWFPSVLGKRRVPSRRIAALLEHTVSSIRKIEKLLHPRLLMISEPIPRRLLGGVLAILASIMSLPIPFGNMLPGWAMALIALGLIERDGVIILVGLAIGIITVSLVFTATHNAVDLIHGLLDKF